MTTILLALSLFLGSAQAALPQDGWSETSFHRIHLRNGNFIDGKVIADKPGEVVLLLRGGEMTVRRDQIDQVEIVKIRSWNEKPIILDAPKATTEKPPKKTDPEVNKTAINQTPMEIRKKVDLLVYKVKNASGDNRHFSIEELQPLGEEGAVYLASRLTGLDAELSMSAAAALRELKSEKSIPVLQDLLVHPNASIRCAAAVALGFQPDAERARYVRPLLSDSDAKVRQTALSLLGSSDDRDLYDPLSDMMADPIREVRSQAILMAGRLASKYGFQEKMSRSLVQLLKDSNDGVRADAASTLGGLGRPELWPSLTELLRDPEAKVRASAAQGLTILAAPESAPDILQAVQGEQDRWTRIYLAGAIQRLRILKAVEPVINWLSDPEEDIRKIAEVTLAMLTGEKLGPDRAKWEAWLQTNRPK